MYLHVNSDGTVAGCTLDWARKVLAGDKAKHICSKSEWHSNEGTAYKNAQRPATSDTYVRYM